MTNENSTGPFEVDAALRDALRTLEQRGAVSGDTRQRVRQRTFEAFDGGELAMSDSRYDVDLVDIPTPVSEQSVGGQGSGGRARWLMAAAFAVVALGTLAWFAGSSEPDVARIADVEDLERGPVLLRAGQFRSEVLGTSVSFTSSGELWLVSETDGRIVLTVDPEDPVASTIQLLRPAGLVPPFQDSSPALLFDGTDPRFGAQFQPALIDGIESRSWRVRLSTESGLTDECGEGQPCVPFFEVGEPVSLVRSRWNDVFEVPQGEFTPLIVLANPAVADTVLTYGEPFQELVDSLVLGEPRPNPVG